MDDSNETTILLGNPGGLHRRRKVFIIRKIKSKGAVLTLFLSFLVFGSFSNLVWVLIEFYSDIVGDAVLYAFGIVQWRI